MCSRIYLLTRFPEYPADYEEAVKLVIVAYGPEQARKLANQVGKREEREEMIWLESDKSRCRHIGDSVSADAMPEILSIERLGVK